MIVTHVHPDADAIASVWLASRFLGTDPDVIFVSAGNPDPAALDAADVVVDVGRVYDPARLRFDHHLPGMEGDCAAYQVWRYANAEQDLEYLAPLVNLVLAGDIGDASAKQSRDVGLHALITGMHARKASDLEVMMFGFQLLDLIEEGLKAKYEARKALARATVYQSNDGLIVAIKDGDQGCTAAAFENGAALVVFQSSYQLADGSTTHAVGVQRSGGRSDPHVGQLIERLANELEAYVQGEELARWFRHPAGFFAGRGTAKAPDARPVTVSLESIAAEMDRVWTR